MSMRPRGGAAATRRSRPAIRPVYEDFKPTSEWKHEDGAAILLYHLPGFAKEQIRILAESRRVLRVRGERLVTSNKWSRFQEEVVVPDDCNMSEIRAKFESGILRIIMPKLVISIDKKHPVEEEANTRLHDLSRSNVTKPNVQPKSQYEGQEELSSNPILATMAKYPQFGTNINPPPSRHINSETSEPLSKKAQEEIISQVKPPTDLKEKHDNQDNPHNNKEDVTQDHKAQLGDYDRGKSKEMETSPIKGKELKEKSNQYDSNFQERGDMDAKDDKIFDHFSEKKNKVNNVAKNHLLTKLNEDGPLMINMGAAILVIVALGTYITHSFGSIV